MRKVGLQLQQGAGGHRKTAAKQDRGRQAHRLIGACRQVAVGGPHRPLLPIERRAGVGLGGGNRRFGQGNLVVRMLRQERRGGGSGGLVLVRQPQQLAPKRQQARPIAPRLLGQQPIDVLKAGQVLLAFEHAVDLLKLGQEVAAAELDLLARAAGTKRIGVDGHGGEWLVDSGVKNDE